jgi:RHS repeat-associated protein
MMNTTVARSGRTALLVALTAIGCGDSHGSGEATAQTAAAVSLSITLANEVGRLVSGGNGLARRYFAYDARGRATAVEHVLDNTPYVFTSTYGFQCSSNACTTTTTAANGPAVVASTFPDSETVTYTFDAGGAPQAINTTPSGGTAQPIVNRILRNSRGQTLEVDYGDKTSTIHHYDDTTDLRLNEIETYLTATPTTVLQLYQYAFDGNGNLTSLTDYCNESSTGACSSSGYSTYSATYTYDSRDQLVGTVRGTVPHSYACDTIGNLTLMEGTTQTYFLSGAGKPTPHALESVGVVSYQYDANGNTTGTTGASTKTAITWNAENMPVTAAYGSNTTSKWFVGESMWKKVVGTATTHYLPSMRDEGSAPCTTAPCAYRKQYGSFAERDWTDTSTCAGTANAADGCLKFYHGDHLGSSTAVTNVSGTVVHRQSYTPFGEDIVTAPPGPFLPKYQFNFKEKETDGTAFYDYGARLYNPATGRWLSPDSVLGEQRYTYCNNPTRSALPASAERRPVQAALCCLARTASTACSLELRRRDAQPLDRRPGRELAPLARDDEQLVEHGEVVVDGLRRQLFPQLCRLVELDLLDPDGVQLRRTERRLEMHPHDLLLGAHLARLVVGLRIRLDERVREAREGR